MIPAMDSAQARELFKQFAGAMAYVAIERPDGSQGIGSAFHVGDGVFVTARHVVEGFKIREIRTTENTDIDLHGDEAKHARAFIHEEGKARPIHTIRAKELQLDSGPFSDPTDGSIDIAIFRVRNYDVRLPWVPLGSHLNDWIGKSDFILSEAIVLGYPPIPLTSEPHLVATRAEVNAQVDLYNSRDVHFILSAMPRGGFSGGLVISEWKFALGMITSSLLMNGQPSELGFFTVVSVEPIYSCLASYAMLPSCQTEGWDGLWSE